MKGDERNYDIRTYYEVVTEKEYHKRYTLSSAKALARFLKLELNEKEPPALCMVSDAYYDGHKVPWQNAFGEQVVDLSNLLPWHPEFQGEAPRGWDCVQS